MYGPVVMETPGSFIVIEGMDGSGKTVLTRNLAAWMNQHGKAAYATAEPSTGPIGALIRQYASGRVLAGLPGTGSTGDKPSAETMALLFAADRSDHMQAEIAPYLAAGNTVICDRYHLSTIVYQSAMAQEQRPGESMDAVVIRSAKTLDWVKKLHAPLRKPTVTLVLLIDPRLAAARVAKRNARSDIFEVPDLQQRVANLYAKAGKLLSEEMVVFIQVEESYTPEDLVLLAMRELASVGVVVE